MNYLSNIVRECTHQYILSFPTRRSSDLSGMLAHWLRRFEPSMLLWLAMIAVLVFLVASPMLRLVISSVQEPETGRSEEHTSELQSLTNLVCRLLLEKKKKSPQQITTQQN